MMIPIDFTPGAEARIAASSPMTVYAAFHASAQGRLDESEELRGSHPEFAAWCRRERHRLAGSFGADWEAGRTLAVELRLATP
jgi:hypothetical protein